MTASWLGTVAMTYRRQQEPVRLHRSIALLAALFLLLRAAVPVGYMPGNLLAGTWAVPCPSGFPAAFFTTGIDEHDTRAHHDGHHGHGHHHTGTRNDGKPPHTSGLDDHCPLGEALQAAVLPVAEAEFRAAPTRTVHRQAPITGRPSQFRPSHAWARAPPLS